MSRPSSSSVVDEEGEAPFTAITPGFPRLIILYNHHFTGHLHTPMHASSPGHDSRDSLDDDIEVIAMSDLDKDNHSPDDSDDENDNGDVALLGHQSPRHDTSSPKRLWPQIKGIVIEARLYPHSRIYLLTMLPECTYIVTHNRESIIHRKVAGSGFCESCLAQPRHSNIDLFLSWHTALAGHARS